MKKHLLYCILYILEWLLAPYVMGISTVVEKGLVSQVQANATLNRERNGDIYARGT